MVKKFTHRVCTLFFPHSFLVFLFRGKTPKISRHVPADFERSLCFICVLSTTACIQYAQQVMVIFLFYFLDFIV